MRSRQEAERFLETLRPALTATAANTEYLNTSQKSSSDNDLPRNRPDQVHLTDTPINFYVRVRIDVDKLELGIRIS